ncbi:TerB family tellurite resistance protein [uncultured Roseovarius sp.]|uniref:tellurite resistance TerB family protein n=1 Tax=uncultured Roseovarius sp. TaxID=293344 RepID=UPI002637F2D9|nr:TerB family tellurite resistance protein [uncultured Roseovarius sp.]
MLHRILHAFSAPRPAPLPEPDDKLALGALMVRIAKSDHQYDVSEIKRIDRLLARLYSLGPLDAARMRATCERLEHAAPDTARFGHVIRETVSLEARLGALEALWEVVLSDGVSHPDEVQVLDAAREAMGLSHADSDAARSLAEGQ